MNSSINLSLFEVIVVHKVDRFSRNRDDHVIYKSLLKKLGVSVYSVIEQTDPETPHGFLLEGIMEVISEFYNMNLKNETMKGMRENAKRGFHNGGLAPYGYRTDVFKDANGATKSIWVLGPDEEIRNIKRIFNMYIHENKGYKAITNTLNTEGVPSPQGKKWSWTTIWHILHNEAYIGQKIWNKHDYSTGKKIKDKNEWIISAGAHPPIIDRDTFNAVRVKSEQRHPTGAAFRSNGPSPFILRGILKCPMCGANMVTGTNSKNSRGKTKYYHCGTYHQKGKTACKRNQVFKEPIENAVINALIREFSILSFPGGLEDEIRRYVDYKNRESTFQISRLDNDIKHLKKRIELARQEAEAKPENSFLEAYISELEKELTQHKQEQDKIEADKTDSLVDPTTLSFIRKELKDFVTGIWTSPCDVQHAILKKYVVSIARELSSNNYKMLFQLKIPGSSSENLSQIILEKQIYFALG
jgi:DNA invertase Pin-like site-specific DNA recombinase/chorismate mutase